MRTGGGRKIMYFLSASTNLYLGVVGVACFFFFNLNGLFECLFCCCGLLFVSEADDSPDDAAASFERLAQLPEAPARSYKKDAFLYLTLIIRVDQINSSPVAPASRARGSWCSRTGCCRAAARWP